MKADKPAPDQAKILKLKSKIKSFCANPEAWEKHCNNFRDLSFKTSERRVCYYCIESTCLDKRTALWMKSPGAKERGMARVD